MSGGIMFGHGKDDGMRLDSGSWKTAAKLSSDLLAGNENIAYSPASIYDALRVLRAGASDKTAREIESIIGKAGEPNLSSIEEFGFEGQDSRWRYDGYKARAALGVWVDESTRQFSSFLDACDEIGAPINVANLSDSAVSSEVSQWIHDNTEGLLSPSIDLPPDALACIASALYLKDAWDRPFDSDDTVPGIFHASSGPIMADFMTDERLCPISDRKGFVIATLHLSNEGQVLFARPDDPDKFEGALAGGKVLDAFEAHLKHPGECEEVSLGIPKFECESGYENLQETLCKAGFKSALAPNLLPMIGREGMPMSIAHAARVALDEKGIEAGAYTVEAVALGLPPEEPPEPRRFILDHPFAFMIVSTNGQPLFVGVVRALEGEPLGEEGVIPDVIGKVAETVEEVKKDKFDDYDFAVMEYNEAYANLSDEGSGLFRQRERAVDLIGFVEALVNSIANHPKSFDCDIAEVEVKKAVFRDAGSFARDELDAAAKSAMSAAGVAGGTAVACMTPSVAMWVATTFGTASTGTAISTLSGAAATQAALAWLGGGALAAGGGGAAAGSALLALAGPIGWGVAGATLLTSIVLFTKRKFDIRAEKKKELEALRENTYRVWDLVEEVSAMAERAERLRTGLSDVFLQCLPCFGSEYAALSREDQDRLAAMVNCTLALAKSLGETVSE